MKSINTQYSILNNIISLNFIRLHQQFHCLSLFFLALLCLGDADFMDYFICLARVDFLHQLT